MSSSSYFFTFLNALPIIMVATKKTSKPWEPSPYYFIFGREEFGSQGLEGWEDCTPPPHRELPSVERGRMFICKIIARALMNEFARAPK